VSLHSELLRPAWARARVPALDPEPPL